MSVIATVYVAFLQQRFTRARERESRDVALARVVSRYREPLMLAAFDLQSRLYNIARKNFLGYLRAGREEDKRYARENTLYLFGQFFGWVEALRVDVQFLDLGDVARARQLNDLQDQVRGSLASDEHQDTRFRIFWGKQRAIGELMLLPAGDAASPDAPRRCMGFASFSARLRDDPEFERWFVQLDQDLVSLAESPGEATRLVATQHALVDLITSLDVQRRLPEKQLTKA